MASLLDAALVSAAVALGVEWLAKPRLEARKERILRQYHARDEVRRALHDILYSAAKLKHQTPATCSSSDQGQQAADAITSATQSLDDVFRTEVMPFAGEQTSDLVAGYIGFVHGVMASTCPEQDRGEQIMTGTAVLIDVLGGPFQGPLYPVRWRYRARRAAELKAFLDA